MLVGPPAAIHPVGQDAAIRDIPTDDAGRPTKLPSVCKNRLPGIEFVPFLKVFQVYGDIAADGAFNFGYRLPEKKRRNDFIRVIPGWPDVREGDTVKT